MSQVWMRGLAGGRLTSHHNCGDGAYGNADEYPWNIDLAVVRE